MEGNNTEQDNLLNQINNLTSGNGTMPESTPMMQDPNMGMPSAPDQTLVNDYDIGMDPNLMRTPQVEENLMMQDPNMGMSGDMPMMQDPNMGTPGDAPMMQDPNMGMPGDAPMMQDPNMGMPGGAPMMQDPNMGMPGGAPMMQDPNMGMPGGAPMMQDPNMGMPGGTPMMQDPNMGMPGGAPMMQDPNMGMPAPNDALGAPVMPNTPLPGEPNSGMGAPTMNQPESRIPVPDNKIPTFDNIVETKKKKKKSNGGLVFVMIILIIAVLVAGTYYAYDLGLLDSVFKPKEEVPSFTDPEMQSPIETPEVPEVEFVDNTKVVGQTEKVFDAGYEMTGLEYEKSYIKLPYINITSDDAKKVNEELAKKYKGYVELSAKDRREEGEYILINYDKFTNGDVVSVVVNELNNLNGKDVVTYYAYNFSVSTGKLLSLNEIEKILEIDANDFYTKLEAYVLSQISGFASAEDKQKFVHKLYGHKAAYELFENITSDDTNYYYIDKDGKLNLFGTLYAGSKELPRKIVYDKTNFTLASTNANTIKQAVKYVAPVKDETNVEATTTNTNTTNTNQNDNLKEAVDTTASSNISDEKEVFDNNIVNATEISETLKDGNVVTGGQVKKVYKDNESDIGIKNEPVTFQVIKNNSTVSFSKGQTSTLDAIIKDEDCYKYEEVKYPSGKLRIIKFVEVR